MATKKRDPDADRKREALAAMLRKSGDPAAAMRELARGGGPPELGGLGARMKASRARAEAASGEVVLENGARVAWDGPEMTFRLTVPLGGWREAELAQALAVLSELAADLDGVCARAREGEDVSQVDVALELPGGEPIAQRAFFEACVAIPALRPAVARFVQTIVDDRRARDAGYGAPPLWHGQHHPFGSFAIVPLALASIAHVPLAIAHMGVTDLGHETFHARWIDMLVARHGWRDETLDLVAYRMQDGFGQRGDESLARAVLHHGLVAFLDAHGAHDAFLGRLERFRAAGSDAPEPDRTAEPGMIMYAGDLPGYRAWLERLAEREGRLVADYPDAPREMRQPARFDPDADWDVDSR